MERTYTNEELKNIDPPPVEFDGKTYSHYECTQVQRSLERTIRKWKRRLAAAVDDKTEQTARARIQVLNQKYEEFSRAAGLRMQKERANVYIPGVTK